MQAHAGNKPRPKWAYTHPNFFQTPVTFFDQQFPKTSGGSSTNNGNWDERKAGVNELRIGPTQGGQIRLQQAWSGSMATVKPMEVARA